MLSASDQFYNKLQTNNLPLKDLLLQKQFFEVVDQDWHVIITDIKGSTKAVLAGLHETVNLIATGSIVAVLNLCYKSGITIPFFFGGDGATFIVPASVLASTMQGLQRYKENTLANFDLELRIGTVPVADIYIKGHHLSISKFNLSSSFSIPVLIGDGLAFAERLIKAEDYLFAGTESLIDEVDLSGMQCRWDKIDPPENNNEIVTILVIATDVKSQAEVFSKVIGYIDQTYGSPQNRQPISIAKLKLKTTFNRLSLEMRSRIGKIKFFELLQTWLISLYGYIYFRTQNGKTYLSRLVEMSDTLVMDGRINTVISGNEIQRSHLTELLNNLEKSGEILYGIHVSNDSIMSCYVRNLEDAHIHFVDGSEGGYTQAAQSLKQKIYQLYKEQAGN